MSHIENQAVIDLLAQDPGQNTMAMAQHLAISEGDLIRALPRDMVTLWVGAQSEALLGQLASWGKLTTIVGSCGSIFEFKGPLPSGRVGRGYYNLMGEEGLHGHLKLDEIAYIALLSKPFMGAESHAFVFIANSGRCVFKIYLGRDEKRRLLPEQLQQFLAWRLCDALPAAPALV